ncbi:MAG: ATP/GTP-binding protein [Anaerolineae bacterium]
MSSYKIVVTGAFNSGKTQFVKTLSDIPVVSTEKRITTDDVGLKAYTTVAMDYGRTTVSNDTLYLYGTPGQARFDFMWDILSGNIDGFIVMVDSTNEQSFNETATIIANFADSTSAPYLVVANKTDVQGAISITTVSQRLNFTQNITVMPCVATQKSSCRQVLLQLIELINKSQPSKLNHKI